MITLNRLREMRAQKNAAVATAQDSADGEGAQKYNVTEAMDSFRTRISDALKEKFSEFSDGVTSYRPCFGDTAVKFALVSKNEISRKDAESVKEKVEEALKEFMPESLIKSVTPSNYTFGGDCCVLDAPCECDKCCGYGTFTMKRFDMGAVSVHNCTCNDKDENKYRIEIVATTPSLFAASYGDIKKNNNEFKAYLDRMSVAAKAPTTHIERIDPTERRGGLKVVEGKFDETSLVQILAMKTLTDAYSQYWENKYVEAQTLAEYERVKAAFEGKEAVPQNTSAQ